MGFQGEGRGSRGQDLHLGHHLNATSDHVAAGIALFTQIEIVKEAHE